MNGTPLEPGQRFGRLVTTRRAPEFRVTGLTYWLCLCDCGKEKFVRHDSLRQGLSKSCGCLHREIRSAAMRASNPRRRLAVVPLETKRGRVA